VTEILDDDETAARALLDTAEMSMGTEVDPSDMDHVVALADQVVELSAYRTRLADYLRARMQALAPNLTTLVGELVGARLVQHAGSIMNLAKQPVQTCVEIKLSRVGGSSP
jgi:nucleolar protein 58